MGDGRLRIGPIDSPNVQRCWRCGYNLYGLTPEAARCPECGAQFSDALAWYAGMKPWQFRLPAQQGVFLTDRGVTRLALRRLGIAVIGPIVLCWALISLSLLIATDDVFYCRNGQKIISPTSALGWSFMTGKPDARVVRFGRISDIDGGHFFWYSRAVFPLACYVVAAVSVIGCSWGMRVGCNRSEKVRAVVAASSLYSPGLWMLGVCIAVLILIRSVLGLCVPYWDYGGITTAGVLIGWGICCIWGLVVIGKLCQAGICRCGGRRVLCCGASVFWLGANIGMVYVAIYYT